MLVSCRGPGLSDSIVETRWRIYACSSDISTNSSGKSLLIKRRPAMDPLTDILRDLRLSSSFYARSELIAPWGLSFSVNDGPSFHVIVRGGGFLRINAERIPLGQAIWCSCLTERSISSLILRRVGRSRWQNCHRNGSGTMLPSCATEQTEQSHCSFAERCALRDRLPIHSWNSCRKSSCCIVRS